MDFLDFNEKGNNKALIKKVNKIIVIPRACLSVIDDTSTNKALITTPSHLAKKPIGPQGSLWIIPDKKTYIIYNFLLKIYI